jgi:hypothetical protein
LKTWQNLASIDLNTSKTRYEPQQEAYLQVKVDVLRHEKKKKILKSASENENSGGNL